MTNISTEKSHLHIVASNSFWNSINFFVTLFLGFLVSVILTRYLGPSRYGVYSYAITLVTVSAMFLDFGIGQAINKYIPRYYDDENNKGLAVNLYKKTLYLKLISAIILLVISLLSFGFIQRLVNIDSSSSSTILLITLFSVLPAVMSSHIVNYLTATQNFRKIVISNTLAQLFNISLVICIVIFKFDLIFAIAVPMLVNVFLALTLYFNVKPLLVYSKTPTKTLAKNDVINFCSMAYLNTIIQFIVWSYSEIFFLNRYAPTREIGFYSLAFGLSAMISSLPNLFLKVIYNAQFELMEKGEHDRADQMTFMSIKYISMIFLPLGIFLSFFMVNISRLLYGHGYEKVGIIFPIILFGTLLSTTMSPLTLKIVNNNKKFRMIIFMSIGGAVLNILLDIALIHRFSSVGAGVANFVSQFSVLVFSLIYILGTTSFAFNWKPLIKVYALNLLTGVMVLLAAIIVTNLWIKIVFALVLVAFYLQILRIAGIFSNDDLLIINSLKNFIPKKAQPVINLITKYIEKAV